ncbi:MAG: helix-turn-helix transcriptional regulator [Muribaculaceae bacterium]|nr:helix-turn-helix transcriptional regulator [Muribaculaceae bacterium]
MSDYIINLRIGAAARKLVHTQMTVSEICYECGFNNVSHFCRCFRLKKSCSPSEFRRMYHKATVDRYGACIVQEV